MQKKNKIEARILTKHLIKSFPKVADLSPSRGKPLHPDTITNDTLLSPPPVSLSKFGASGQWWRLCGGCKIL